MTTIKKVAVCIAEDGLHVMEYTSGALKMIKLPSFPAGRNETGGIFTRNSDFNYDIELEQQTSYLEQLKSVITHYDSLILFGPTNLKVDLYNLLRKDDSFAKTNIEIIQTQAMTETQQQEFVMDYFENTEQER